MVKVQNMPNEMLAAFEDKPELKLGKGRGAPRKDCLTKFQVSQALGVRTSARLRLKGWH